jgi:hypothetical protein
MTTPSAPTPDDAAGTNGDGYWLFTDLAHASIEPALDRFRALVAAHNNFEPRLRTERHNGRRRYVLDIYVRTGLPHQEEPSS